VRIVVENTGENAVSSLSSSVFKVLHKGMEIGVKVFWTGFNKPADRPVYEGGESMNERRMR
jgi:hypothetical protein